MNCWGGLQHARALLQFSKLPRRDGFACPACKTAPPVGDYWKCGKCGSALTPSKPTQPVPSAPLNSTRPVPRLRQDQSNERLDGRLSRGIQILILLLCGFIATARIAASRINLFYAVASAFSIGRHPTCALSFRVPSQRVETSHFNFPVSVMWFCTKSQVSTRRRLKDIHAH